ncbi:MAG TPA: NAD-dependent epimerase/dehydratase family protein [Gemmatimonadaceae bacterium]|nr:NAD-dependent epimerase/dehydratase family protein [Gemmatimonadaceae bacterium]
MPERALITGAAGFIGSHVVDALLERGWSVTGLDNFDSFYDPAVKRENLESAMSSPHFRLVEGDVRDLRLMQRVVEEAQPDVVIHLAARAGVRPSIEQPTLYAEVNVGGTSAVLEAALRAGVRRLVVASSSSVYGDSATPPFREDDPALHPVSPYAATKRAAELVCECWSSLVPDARIISLRFFTVYGPRQRPDLAIHKFTRLLLSDRPIPFFGDGESSRDYTYITDIVDGVLGAVTRTGSGNGGHEIFNLGESATTSLKELVALLEEVTGKRAVLERLPPQQGDVRRTFADISRARSALGYAPSVPVREGIPKFVTWYRERAAGRQPVTARAASR